MNRKLKHCLYGKTLILLCLLIDIPDLHFHYWSAACTGMEWLILPALFEIEKKSWWKEKFELLNPICWMFLHTSTRNTWLLVIINLEKFLCSSTAVLVFWFYVKSFLAWLGGFIFTPVWFFRSLYFASYYSPFLLYRVIKSYVRSTHPFVRDQKM